MQECNKHTSKSRSLGSSGLRLAVTLLHERCRLVGFGLLGSGAVMSACSRRTEVTMVLDDCPYTVSLALVLIWKRNKSIKIWFSLAYYYYTICDHLRYVSFVLVCNFKVFLYILSCFILIRCCYWKKLFLSRYSWNIAEVALKNHQSIKPLF